jgi:hypothetical protein
MDLSFVWVSLAASLTCAVDGCILVAVLYATRRNRSAAAWAVAIGGAHLVFEVLGLCLGNSLTGLGDWLGYLIALIAMLMMVRHFLKEITEHNTQHEHGHDCDHGHHRHAPMAAVTSLQLIWMVCILSRDAFGLGAALNGIMIGAPFHVLLLSCLIVAVLVGFYTWVTARLISWLYSRMTSRGGNSAETAFTVTSVAGLQILIGFTAYLGYGFLDSLLTLPAWVAPVTIVAAILVSAAMAVRYWSTIRLSYRSQLLELEHDIEQHGDEQHKS